MKVWGLSESDIRRIVEEVSGKEYEGNLIINNMSENLAKRVPTYTVTLRVQDSRGSGASLSLSWAGERRSIAACWHAHRDVMQEFFHAGATRIQTVWIDYKSEEDFENNHRETLFKNVGSMAYPVYPRDKCAHDGCIFRTSY